MHIDVNKLIHSGHIRVEYDYSDHSVNKSMSHIYAMRYICYWKRFVNSNIFDSIFDCHDCCNCRPGRELAKYVKSSKT